jgi:enoyl-CoA hydratase/carnithine racemase
MSSDIVLYHSKDRIATITLNRPDKLNALSNALVGELRDALIHFEKGDDRVAVLTGAGERAFSAGADLRDPPRDPELWECMPGVGVPLSKPTIASVAGHCVGGGVCLVEFCTLAVAAENADFSYPEAQLGFCGGLISGLAVRIPYKVAMELMLTGAHMKAARAYKVGMVNAVVPLAERMEAAYGYARRLAESAPLVLGLLETFTRDMLLPRGPSEMSAIARRHLLRVAHSEDAKEGARSFAEKRKPRFTGR